MSTNAYMAMESFYLERRNHSNSIVQKVNAELGKDEQNPFHGLKQVFQMLYAVNMQMKCV